MSITKTRQTVSDLTPTIGGTDMTDMLRYKWTSFGPMLDEDGPFVLLVDAEAAEARVREDERSNNFTPDDHADGMTESYHRGFDDARWIAAKEALEGVQHENCDCEPCQSIARALAELRTIGQD
jgi:hypothetical protein